MINPRDFADVLDVIGDVCERDRWLQMSLLPGSQRGRDAFGLPDVQTAERRAAVTPLFRGAIRIPAPARLGDVAGKEIDPPNAAVLRPQLPHAIGPVARAIAPRP